MLNTNVFIATKLSNIYYFCKYFFKNMFEQQKEIGRRLQEIRNIYNGGFKASIEQFSAELNENKYNISNYEAGKASIPNRVLFSLYEKGFNPIYILSGEGSYFAENDEGQKKSFGFNENSTNNIKIIDNSSFNKKIIGKLGKQASKLNAAAGKLTKKIYINEPDK